MQDNRQAGPAFIFGLILGAAIGVLASSPRSRAWMKDKAEWARTDGKEALGSMKQHAREGMEAVRGSAQNIAEDARTLKKRAKTEMADSEL